MGVVTGTLTISAASAFQLETIDPPTISGFVHRIRDVSLMIAGDDTANTAERVPLICSINATEPASLTYPNDLYADSTLWAWLPLFTTGKEEATQFSEGLPTLGHREIVGWSNEEQYFQDKFYLIGGAPTANVAAGKYIRFYYRILYEDVRMTNTIRDQLLARMYS